MVPSVYHPPTALKIPFPLTFISSVHSPMKLMQFPELMFIPSIKNIPSLISICPINFELLCVIVTTAPLLMMIFSPLLNDVPVRIASNGVFTVIVWLAI